MMPSRSCWFSIRMCSSTIARRAAIRCVEFAIGTVDASFAIASVTKGIARAFGERKIAQGVTSVAAHRSIDVRDDLRGGAENEESLLDADGRLPIAGTVHPVREIKSPRSRDRFFLQLAKRADIDTSKLWHQVDVRRSTQGMRDRVTAMVVRAGTQGVSGHAALVSDPAVVTATDSPGCDQALAFDV